MICYTFRKFSDSLSLVLQETLKNLEQRDVRNSKLLQEKDEFIKYLTETQATILNVVTSEKNHKRKHKTKYKR